MADWFSVLGDALRAPCSVSQSFGVKLFTQLTRLSLICVLQMYFRCTINLCIPTLPSKKCPDLCSHSFSPRVMVGNLYTETYTVTSAPVSLLTSTSTTSPPVPTAASTSASIPTQPTTANGKILYIFSFPLNRNTHKGSNNPMLVCF